MHKLHDIASKLDRALTTKTTVILSTVILLIGMAGWAKNNNVVSAPEIIIDDSARLDRIA